MAVASQLKKQALCYVDCTCKFQRRPISSSTFFEEQLNQGVEKESFDKIDAPHYFDLFVHFNLDGLRFKTKLHSHFFEQKKLEEPSRLNILIPLPKAASFEQNEHFTIK